MPYDEMPYNGMPYNGLSYNRMVGQPPPEAMIKPPHPSFFPPGYNLPPHEPKEQSPSWSERSGVNRFFGIKEHEYHCTQIPHPDGSIRTLCTDDLRLRDRWTPNNLGDMIARGEEAPVEDYLRRRHLAPADIELSLRHAISEGKPRILERLIEVGRPGQDVLNRALIEAVLWNNPEALRVLVAAGASNFQEAMDLARRYNRQAVQRELGLN